VEQIAALRAVLQRYYTLLVPAFMFYSCSVSAMPFFMGLNEFTAFLDECAIPDNESQGVKRSDLDTVFIVCTRKVCLCNMKAEFSSLPRTLEIPLHSRGHQTLAIMNQQQGYDAYLSHLNHVIRFF
jgi:hypothetical protein